MPAAGFSQNAGIPHDSTNKHLKVLHCSSRTNCRGGNSITSPDTGGNVGKMNSRVLNADGNPIVSYHISSRGNLKVLTCDDPNCAK